jgi:hypothetical protein
MTNFNLTFPGRGKKSNVENVSPEINKNVPLIGIYEIKLFLASIL